MNDVAEMKKTQTEQTQLSFSQPFHVWVKSAEKKSVKPSTEFTSNLVFDPDIHFSFFLLFSSLLHEISWTSHSRLRQTWTTHGTRHGTQRTNKVSKHEKSNGAWFFFLGLSQSDGKNECWAESAGGRSWSWNSDLKSTTWWGFFSRLTIDPSKYNQLLFFFRSLILVKCSAKATKTTWKQPKWERK